MCRTTWCCWTVNNDSPQVLLADSSDTAKLRKLAANDASLRGRPANAWSTADGLDWFCELKSPFAQDRQVANCDSAYRTDTEQTRLCSQALRCKCLMPPRPRQQEGAYHTGANFILARFMFQDQHRSTHNSAPCVMSYMRGKAHALAATSLSLCLRRLNAAAFMAATTGAASS